MTLNQQIDREMRWHGFWCFVEGLVIGIGLTTVWVNWERLFGG